MAMVSIIMLPLYLRYLGAEAYGLVGFFAVLQAWLTIMDMGLSPSLGRHVAYSRGSQCSSGWIILRKLLRSMEIIFFVLGVGIALIVWLSSEWISTKWLNVEQLSLNHVSYSISLMGIIIALRLFSSLYRSGIQGMERQVWFNVANIIVSTLRFIGAYVLLRWISQDVTRFFEYQLLISLIEVGLFYYGLYEYLPYNKTKIYCGFSWEILKPVLPFACGITYATFTWILITQIDKLILSKALPLKEYGYYALAVVVSNGLMTISGPISQAILPRMTYLLSQGNEGRMLALYRKATQFVAIIVCSVVGVISINSIQLLYAWTGNMEAAKWAGPVLTWFALGTGILSISAFQYYLQFAHGKLKLHVLNSTLNAFLQVPIIVYFAFTYGALGVAISWFLIRLLSFIIFPPIVHHFFARGLHKSWLFHDILPIVTVSIFSTYILHYFLPKDSNRVEILGFLFCFGIIILSVNIIASSEARQKIVSYFFIKSS